MKQNENSNKFPPYADQHPKFIAQKSIAIYRVTLVKDKTVSFGHANLCNSHQGHAVLQNLILTRGQPDREQFVVALLSAKNQMIGMNIVSVGALSATTVHPREVLKPAILSNSAAILLCHNHPSNDLNPSADDLAITRTIIQAATVVGIQVHEHLIINLENDQYFNANSIYRCSTGGSFYLLP